MTSYLLNLMSNVSTKKILNNFNSTFDGYLNIRKYAALDDPINPTRQNILSCSEISLPDEGSRIHFLYNIVLLYLMKRYKKSLCVFIDMTFT